MDITVTTGHKRSHIGLEKRAYKIPGKSNCGVEFLIVTVLDQNSTI